MNVGPKMLDKNANYYCRYAQATVYCGSNLGWQPSREYIVNSKIQISSNGAQIATEDYKVFLVPDHLDNIPIPEMAQTRNVHQNVQQLYHLLEDMPASTYMAAVLMGGKHCVFFYTDPA